MKAILILLLAAAPALAQVKAGPPSPPPPPRAALPPSAQDTADLQLYKGNLRAAKEALDPGIARSPDSYALLLRRAYIFYLMGDWEGAERDYQACHAIDATEAAPLQGLYYTALARNDPSWKARAEALLAVQANHRDALLRLGYAAFLEKDQWAASDYYGAALDYYPGDLDATLGLAWSDYYQRRYWQAKEGFKQVLDLMPKNLSAQQGLALTPNTVTVGVGFYYAAIDYSKISYKKGGRSYGAPVTFTWKDLWTLNITPSRTVIDFKSPVSDTVQRELDVTGTYWVSPSLSLSGAYDSIDNDDKTTDGGKIYAAGFYYTQKSDMMQDGGPALVSIGGYGAQSDYPLGRVSQISPLVGFGTTGSWWTEVGYNNITVKPKAGLLEHLSSGFMTVAVWPRKGLSFKGTAFAGKKRLPVENWGAVIANTSDLYKGGWRLNTTYGRGRWSYYLILGGDRLEAVNSGFKTRYKDSLIAAGAQVSFGR